jgi:hypothetical protein
MQDQRPDFPSLTMTAANARATSDCANAIVKALDAALGPAKG